MKRSEFDSHPLWKMVEDALDQVESIEPVDGDEAVELERIQFLLDYVLSHREMGTAYAAFFTGPMLDSLVSHVQQVSSYMANRVSTTQYRAHTTSAIPYAESLLVDMAPWPRRYAKGAAVTQMNTLFEDLLEMQAKHLKQQEVRQANVLQRFDSIEDSMLEKQNATQVSLGRVEASAMKVSDQIVAASTRIDQVVQTGLETIDGMKAQNSDAFKEWRVQTDNQWKADYNRIEKDLVLRNAQADDALLKLQGTISDYEKLSSLGAADVLAKHFATASRNARLSSSGLFVLGFIFLIAAAIPFIPLILTAVDSPPSWESIGVRASFGVLAGSAAAVAIRLGSRFSNEATAGKRMEMELRTFGPFLATNADQENVDSARLELVDRAFGKSYIAHLGAKPDEDTVPVSGLTDIINAISRVTGK
ncbi:hypothetical protein [Arthrobacter sp. CP30]